MNSLPGPVFLLATGGRTGSTLVQRLILSTRQVMMWGEHGGILLPRLRELFLQVEEWNQKTYDHDALVDFRKSPQNSWAANINPGAPFFFAACRAFLDASLGAAARETGFPRWGFKEIRYGATEALALQRLYPHARFVFLTRNPVDCLRSIKAAGWYEQDFAANPFSFLQEWSRISGELADVQPKLQHACLIRYEDLVSEPEKTVGRIAHTIGVPVNAFDLSVLGQKLRGSESAPLALDQADIEALRQPLVQEQASRFGYPLPV